MNIEDLRIGQPIKRFNDIGEFLYRGRIEDINKKYGYIKMRTTKGIDYFLSITNYGIGWELESQEDLIQRVANRALELNDEYELRKVKCNPQYTNKEIESFISYEDLITDLSIMTNDQQWFNEITGGINNG